MDVGILKITSEHVGECLMVVLVKAMLVEKNGTCSIVIHSRFDDLAMLHLDPQLPKRSHLLAAYRDHHVPITL